MICFTVKMIAVLFNSYLKSKDYILLKDPYSDLESNKKSCAHVICSLQHVHVVNDALCPLSCQLESPQISASEDEQLILHLRCVHPWQAVKDREGVEG